jgi:hypothetical protein
MIVLCHGKLSTLFSDKAQAALLYCAYAPLKWVQEILEVFS